jgi:outer membrane protein OmpA-like peptidoglycan-associated protein
MEPRFGHDFSRVRVHTNAKATESAQAVNALSYTVGQDVVFRAEQYAPETTEGRELMAHELAHAVQQRHNWGTVHTAYAVGPVDDTHEREATSVAKLVTADGERIKSDLTPALPSVAGCTPVGGDITDVGASSDELYLFRVNCDDFLPGEEDRLIIFAGTILPHDTLEIHGFASEEGPAEFNEDLSCARAQKAWSVLNWEGIGASQVQAIYKHGETPGSRRERRSAVVHLHRIPSPPPGCTTPTNPDLSGRANNPTTDSEAVVALTNLIDAISANSAANDAHAAAAASGLAGPHLGPQDAFRHCVWNCLMAQRIGASEAEKFATAHENSGTSSIPFDNQMDLHNNATGRSLGTPGTNCSTACMSALTSGHLRTIRGPHTRPQATPPILTACIGASDQPWP